jgi:hypothetical protein
MERLGARGQALQTCLPLQIPYGGLPLMDVMEPVTVVTVSVLLLVDTAEEVC